MDIKKVMGVYFSPAGSTKTVVETTADELARLFKAECRYISLNTPSDRAQEYQFAPDELVVFGCPVYAGRLPNKISPDFARCLHGEGTPAVALVTYGGSACRNVRAADKKQLQTGGRRRFSVPACILGQAGGRPSGRG